MKSFKVVVTYQDVQPGEETTTHDKTYRVLEAEDEFHAEGLAMEMCAQEYWTHEPIEAVAQEFCFQCHNTGYENDGPDDVRPCEGENHLDEAASVRKVA